MRNIYHDLYDFLLKALPAYVSPVDGSLSVPRLSDDLEMSREGVYKWLRSDKLNPKAANKLIVLAHSPANLEKLAEANASPPVLADFVSFFG